MLRKSVIAGIAQDRFETKFEKGPGCWEWMAGKDQDGYGMFGVNRKLQGAHRVAYKLYVGEIPEGMCVCHRCDNPSCVRPDHLFLGTNADNTRDRVNKGRSASNSGEKCGHSRLTAEQVLAIRLKWADGVRNMALAAEYNVARATISLIVHRHNWTKLINAV